MSDTNTNEFDRKRKAQERDEFTADVDSFEYGAQQRAAVDAWERQREARMSAEEREARRKVVGDVEHHLKRFDEGDINARTFLGCLSGMSFPPSVWSCEERDEMPPRPRAPPSPRTYWPGKRVAPCSPISLSRPNSPNYEPTSPSYSPTSPNYTIVDEKGDTRAERLGA